MLCNCQTCIFTAAIRQTPNGYLAMSANSDIYSFCVCVCVCPARCLQKPLPVPLPETCVGLTTAGSVVAVMLNVSPVTASKMVVMVQIRRPEASLRYLMWIMISSVSSSLMRCTGVVRQSKLQPTSQSLVSMLMLQDACTRATGLPSECTIPLPASPCTGSAIAGLRSTLRIVIYLAVSPDSERVSGNTARL